MTRSAIPGCVRGPTARLATGPSWAGQVNLVAPRAPVVAYRVLDSDGVGNPYVIAEAVNDAADDGVGVINMSFGSQSRFSGVLDRAIKRAASRGVVVVAAAGNMGSSDGLFPGNAEYVLSVACGEPETGQLASFSSYGSWVDVAAPCENILGSLPDSVVLVGREPRSPLRW